MERRGFKSLLVSISPNAAVDQRASEVAEKARFQEKETHDNLIAQEEAHLPVASTWPPADFRQVQPSAERHVQRFWRNRRSASHPA